jgi:hypothetical protein
LRFKLSDSFKKKLSGACEVLCVSIINFFGVKLWSRLSIIMGLATWLCYAKKISGAEWVIVALSFGGIDFARSKWLEKNGDGSNGTSPIDKIKEIIMGKGKET